MVYLFVSLQILHPIKISSNSSRESSSQRKPSHNSCQVRYDLFYVYIIGNFYYHHFNEYTVICILIINVSKLLTDLIAIKLFAFWKFCTLFFIYYYNPKYLGFYFMWAVKSARKNHKFFISRAPRIRGRNYSCNFSTRFWSWYSQYFPSIQLFPEILEQSV